MPYNSKNTVKKEEVNMINLLSRIFIKNYTDTENQEVRQAYGVLCGAMGIFLNLLLFAGKFLAGLLSSSIAITADAFNNLSDAGSSIITLIGFRMAGQKPDPDHPFGHGRIEYISGLLVSIIILIMAFELIKSSIVKIIHPEELQYSPLIIWILLISILVKCYMFYYNRKISRKIHSAAMAATATDSLSDTVATSVVLIATLISHFSGLLVDGYCGVLVGLFICYAGISAARDTISPLLGQAPDPDFVQQIQNIVLSHEDILGIHDLIVHNYGPGRVFISLHAEVPADGDILTMHDMIDTIEHKLRDTLHCGAVIHMDPVCVNDQETMTLKEEVIGCLQEIAATISYPGPLNISVHDFRLVQGPTHTNVIFDVVVPYDIKLTDAELTGLITEKIQEQHPSYFTVIEVDKEFCKH